MPNVSGYTSFYIRKWLNDITLVAAGAFFVYDWLLTLGMEVELIWRSKWNYIKVLYLFQRYLTFYDTFYASYKRESSVVIILAPFHER